MALHTASVDHSRAVIDEASSVLEGEAILALGASSCTKSGTAFDPACTVDEGECGQTGGALFLEVLQAARLEGEAEAISGEIEARCALDAAVDVALGAIRHLREGDTVGVDQSEPTTAVDALSQSGVVLAVGNNGEAYSVLQEEPGSTSQTGIAWFSDAAIDLVSIAVWFCREESGGALSARSIGVVGVAAIGGGVLGAKALSVAEGVCVLAGLAAAILGVGGTALEVDDGGLSCLWVGQRGEEQG